MIGTTLHTIHVSEGALRAIYRSLQGAIRTLQAFADPSSIDPDLLGGYNQVLWTLHRDRLFEEDPCECPRCRLVRVASQVYFDASELEAFLTREGVLNVEALEEADVERLLLRLELAGAGVPAERPS